MSLYDQHRVRFEGAQAACRERFCWSPFPEMPSKYPDAAQAQASGLAAFTAHLGGVAPRRFDLDQPGTIGELGEEVSPYTRQPLGVRYPQADVDALFGAASTAIWNGWWLIPSRVAWNPGAPGAGSSALVSPSRERTSKR